jgi:hypothetical protein
VEKGTFVAKRNEVEGNRALGSDVQVGIDDNDIIFVYY